MDKYRNEQLERAEEGHDWNFNIKAVFSGTSNKSKYLDIPYKDWVKIKEILANSNLN